jgi:hypothetical protein
VDVHVNGGGSTTRGGYRRVEHIKVVAAAGCGCHLGRPWGLDSYPLSSGSSLAVPICAGEEIGGLGRWPSRL